MLSFLIYLAKISFLFQMLTVVMNVMLCCYGVNRIPTTGQTGDAKIEKKNPLKPLLLEKTLIPHF